MGRYAIYDKIASGGMASVHFGRLIGAIGFTRTVAIKRLHPHLLEDPDFAKTMMDEARLSARIHHPNVVSTLDVVTTDSELLIVMEYVRGESVARLTRGLPAGTNRIPLPIVSAIVAGALQGLHAAHEATSDLGTPLDIVHRDVSPQNILVGTDGTARIIDFGVAKATGRIQTTSDGVVKGKIPYMAPEQLRGQPVTGRVDVYAMGVVLWQLVTGRKLFPGEDQASLIGQILAGARVPPSRHAPDVPEGLDALVMKALAIEPGNRFATAREMAEALVALVPPPQPAEVGAWVQEVARQSLARRAAILAEIESASASVVESGDVVEHISRIGRAPRTDGETKEEGGTEVSSVAQATPRESERSRRTGARLAIVVGIAAAAAVPAGVMLMHRVNGAPSRAAVAAPVGSPVAATEQTGVPAPTFSVLSPASAPEIASAAVPPVSSPSPAATSSASAPRSVRRSAGGKPPSAPPPRNCNPDFFYDAAGQKIFKPECFAR